MFTEYNYQFIDPIDFKLDLSLSQSERLDSHELRIGNSGIIFTHHEIYNFGFLHFVPNNLSEAPDNEILRRQFALRFYAGFSTLIDYLKNTEDLTTSALVGHTNGTFYQFLRKNLGTKIVDGGPLEDEVNWYIKINTERLFENELLVGYLGKMKDIALDELS